VVGQACAEFLDRPFAGRQKVDQPLPDDPTCDVAVELRDSNVAVERTMLANLLNYGAGNETRTRDPDLGKVVLYQLSYSRISSKQGRNCRSKHREVKADRGGRSQ
jgi:hypothetical protein